MLKRIAITIAVAGFVATLAPPTAMAGLQLTFNLDNAFLDVVPDTATHAYLDAEDGNTTSSSALQVYLEDPDEDPKIRDSATINDYDDFGFLLALEFTKTAGTWSAAGTLKFTDTGDDLTDPQVLADFTSTTVLYGGGEAHYLLVVGNLTTVSGEDSILLDTGDDPDWVYAGTGENSTEDADGTANQVTMPNRWYGGGILTTMKFGGISHDTLDDMLTTAETYDGGHVAGTIVPAPAAVGLGLLGLALMGWRVRRYA